jgi:phosphoribosylaminoimidazole (AIR) synthetase
MIVCVAPENLESALTLLKEMGEMAWPIGNIEAHASETIRLDGITN